MCQLPAAQALMATNDRLPADELELSTKKRKLGILRKQKLEMPVGVMPITEESIGRWLL